MNWWLEIQEVIDGPVALPGDGRTENSTLLKAFILDDGRL